MSDPSNVVATRNGSVQRDEINLITKELHKLEEEAKSQFPQERAALLRRLNSVQASTSVLPPETLSYIIQHVYHSNNAGRYSRPFPQNILKLGHVSSYWRQVVWSTPQLWSSLAMDIYCHNFHTVVPLLQLYLRNVASLSLSVDLSFLSGALSSDEFGDSIASVLSHETNAAKIRSLRLYSAPWDWAPQLNNPNFSSLKCLNLIAFQGQHQDSDVLDLTELPCLRDLVLGIQVIPTAIKLCWSEITLLELQAIYIDTCLKLLTSCPNLIEFRCSDPMDPVSSPSTTPNHRLHEIITLKHLEIFEWTHHRDPCCLEALRHLRLPALKDLSWNRACEAWEEKHTILTLVSNLPSTLPSFTLIRSNWSAPFLKDVFKQIGHLDHLLLDRCPGSIITLVFSTLTQDADAGDHSMLLSSLKTLVIQGFEEQIGFEIDRHILRFLQNRFRKGCLEFCLKFENNLVDWCPEVREELCRMRREGFKLEIYRNSKKLDWLEAA